MEIDMNVVLKSKVGRLFLLIAGVAMVFVTGYFYIFGNIKANRLVKECTESVNGVVYTNPYSGPSTNFQGEEIGAKFEIDGRRYNSKGIDNIEHHPGDEIKIHFNPQDPSFNYAGIEPVRVPHVIGILFIFCGCMMILAWYKVQFRN